MDSVYVSETIRYETILRVYWCLLLMFSSIPYQCSTVTHHVCSSFRFAFCFVVLKNVLHIQQMGKESERTLADWENFVINTWRKFVLVRISYAYIVQCTYCRRSTEKEREHREGKGALSSSIICSQMPEIVWFGLLNICNNCFGLFGQRFEHWTLDFCPYYYYYYYFWFFLFFVADSLVYVHSHIWN